MDLASIGVTGSDSPLAAESDVALIVETLDNTNIFTPTISRTPRSSSSTSCRLRPRFGVEMKH